MIPEQHLSSRLMVTKDVFETVKICKARADLTVGDHSGIEPVVITVNLPGNPVDQSIVWTATYVQDRWWRIQADKRFFQ
jgi:hypothetical protein